MAFRRKRVMEYRDLYNSFNLMYQGEKIEADELSKWYVDEDRNVYFTDLKMHIVQQSFMTDCT